MTLSVDDIRPRDVMAGQRAAAGRDIDWLMARRHLFIPSACPACGANAGTALYEKSSLRYVRCSACSTQYADPRPSEALLNEFRARSENYKYWAEVVFPRSEAVRREKLFRPRAQIAAEVARQRGLAGATLLEIGAGYGWFCEEAKATGAFSRVVGLEPTPDLAQACRARGLEVIETPYESFVSDEKFDLIASFEVIEHLHDPQRFVAWCAATLRPGGVLLLTCPNIGGFETRALGAVSGTVEYEHVNLFTTGSLAAMVARQGFTEIEVETPGELDVEIVREALQQGKIGPEAIGAFLADILMTGTVEQRRALQRFLQEARMSSHMRLVARRATGP